MRLLTDYASTTLAQAITDTATQIEVTNADNFPVIPAGSTDFAVLFLENASGEIEQIKQTHRDNGSNTITIERNYDGQGAYSYDAGSVVELRTNASLFNTFFQRGVGDKIDADTETTLQVKRYTTTVQAPANGELVEGQMAVNIPDRKVWVGAVGAVVGDNNPPIIIAGAGDSATVIEVSQVAHGFSAGEPLYLDGNTWKSASAGAAASLATHLVYEVRTADAFLLAVTGEIVGINPVDIGLAQIVSGTYYYVSPTNAGELTATRPTGVGQYANPMALGLGPASLAVLPYQARVATSAPEVVADIDLTGRSLNSNPIILAIDPNYTYKFDFAAAVTSPPDDVTIFVEVGRAAGFTGDQHASIAEGTWWTGTGTNVGKDYNYYGTGDPGYWLTSLQNGICYGTGELHFFRDLMYDHSWFGSINTQLYVFDTDLGYELWKRTAARTYGSSNWAGGAEAATQIRVFSAVAHNIIDTGRLRITRLPSTG